MSKNIIALDIGASKTAIGVISHNNQVLYYHQITTPTKGGQKIFLKKIIDLINPLIDKKIKAIAIGIAGAVENNGQKLFLNNFPKNCQIPHLQKTLKEKFKLPVIINNDVNCFTIAEALDGAGKKYQNVLGITIGTGVGGGIVINKKLYSGYHNLAGEFGHHSIPCLDSPVKCSCGQTNHWEVLASGTALTKIYQELTKKKITSQEIIGLAQKKNPSALRAIKTLTDYLGIGLANLINCWAPDIVIIGGGLSKAKLLWPLLRQSTYQRVWHPQLKNIKIVPSKLGDHAILIGASILANNPNKFKL